MDPGVGWVIPLKEAAECDERLIGGKAAKLAQLAQAGFRVPDGFFITTKAYEYFLEEAGPGPPDPHGTGPQILRVDALGGDLGCGPAHPLGLPGERPSPRPWPQAIVAAVEELGCRQTAGRAVVSARRGLGQSLLRRLARIGRRRGRHRGRARCRPRGVGLPLVRCGAALPPGTGPGSGPQPHGGRRPGDGRRGPLRCGLWARSQGDQAATRPSSRPCRVPAATWWTAWSIPIAGSWTGAPGEVLEWRPGEREDEAEGKPILETADLSNLHQMLLQVESLFQWPPDTEWTGRGERFTLLQARPITTAVPEAGDQRGWYLSLRPACGA